MLSSFRQVFVFVSALKQSLQCFSQIGERSPVGHISWGSCIHLSFLRSGSGMHLHPSFPHLWRSCGWENNNSNPTETKITYDQQTGGTSRRSFQSSQLIWLWKTMILLQCMVSSVVMVVDAIVHHGNTVLMVVGRSKWYAFGFVAIGSMSGLGKDFSMDFCTHEVPPPLGGLTQPASHKTLHSSSRSGTGNVLGALHSVFGKKCFASNIVDMLLHFYCKRT